MCTTSMMTLKGLENIVINRGVSLLEGFISTEMMTLVTESVFLCREVLKLNVLRVLHLGLFQHSLIP